MAGARAVLFLALAGCDSPPNTQKATALAYWSKDGDECYPGTLDGQVMYTLTSANTLRLAYTATTDQSAVLNLTNPQQFQPPLRPGHRRARPRADY